ncbi:glycosyl hydrolase [Sandaracinus amylolyticus]|uniref:glycosyl hydrolase n=1 Tax=Sandaracinus amylolyticus TaxID=927083 RepID=UPI001EEEC282|nr:glycosyl hydrolase [Sandaracinus amylolyticus]UJR80756.1 Glycoside hydrolase [Sandaracinus amylolyticus]
MNRSAMVAALVSLLATACTGNVMDDGDTNDAGLPPLDDGATPPPRDGATPDDASTPPPPDFVDPDPADLEPGVTCGSYATGATDVVPIGTQYRAPELEGPLPTHRSWSSVGWDFRNAFPHSNNLYMHPISARAERDGLGVRHLPAPSVTPDGRFYEHILPIPAQLDALRIGVQGLDAPDTRLADHSDWTFTARWSDGTRELRATLGSGLPFAYFRVRGGAARVSINAAFRAGARIVLREGPRLVIEIEGVRYAIFAPSGATWRDGAEGELLADLGGRDHLSLAVLPDHNDDTLEFYTEHAYAFVDDTRVRWAYDEARGEVRVRYEAHATAVEPGASDVPLMALMPHHARHSDARLADLYYASPRGRLQVLEANAFETRVPFRGVLPALPLADRAHDARLRTLLREVDLNAAYPAPSYATGKLLGKYAELLVVAEQLGETEIRDRLLARLRQGLEQWLSPNDGGPSRLRYLDAWSTIVPEPADFGAATELNDHHFHWGYLLHAAALVALHDPAWAEAWAGSLLWLVRDATSPLRDDPMFPFLRTFDPWEGHSWASGHAGFAHGNNQESSSESMHYSSSLILFGEATGNRTLRDLGVYLYAVEATSIAEYWLDVHDDVFPESFQHPVVGIVWGAGGSYSTWWTAEPEAIHGINLLPFHGGSLYLGHHAAHLGRTLDHLVEMNGGPEGTGGGPDDWVDVIWLARAYADPDDAWARYSARADSYPVEAGQTRAHTLHTLATLRDLGRIDATVSASAATAAVFDRGGTRTHVAYHAGCEGTRTVTFGDGASVEVPARTLIAERGGATVATISLGSCTAGPPPACP